MIDPEFLRLLVCPATRQPLRLASAAELAACNAAIAAGGVANRGGTALSAPLQAGLVPTGAAAGASVVYPIVDGIPILLTAEAVPLPVGSTA
jgi:uncharacterized protein YbaR (Trm112 family)